MPSVVHAGLIAAVDRNQAPFISLHSVQAALDALLYSATSVPGQPLLGLSLVDEQLTDPAAPRGAHLRHFALHTLLVDTITQAYNRQRAVLGLPAVDVTASVVVLASALALDAQTGNHELLAWSVLYARYVRVDAALQQPDLADALNSNVRSIRRYQQHGVRRLTEALTAAEWSARRRQRRRRLSIALPSSEPLSLFGRDRELAALFDVLDQAPPHAVIIGAPGIGKTALVQGFLHKLIADDRFAAVAWLNDPPSVGFAYSQVRMTLLPPDADIEIREFLALRPTAIVLDGVDALWANPTQLDQLLQAWSSALVLVTSTRYLPFSQPHILLRLSELSRQAAATLVHHVSAGVHEAEDVPALSDMVWAAVGGHPLALTLLTRRTELLPALDGVEVGQTVEPLFRSAYDTLALSHRRALYAFVAMPVGLVSTHELLSIWHGLFTPSDVTELLRTSWLTRRSVEAGLVELPQAARQYLYRRLEHDTAAQATAVTLLDSLDRALRAGNSFAAQAAEHVIWAHRLPLTVSLRRSWLNYLWRRVAPAEALPRWRVLLEGALAASPVGSADLKLMYGVCLRRLGDWEEAADALAGAISDAGHSGDFLIQAEALAELATLERYRGAYESALARLGQAEGSAQRLNARALLDTIALERAQIAVDSGNAAWAEAQLALLADSLRVLALKAEVRLLQGDLDEAEQLINLAYDYLPAADYTAEARLRTILGRAHQQAGAATRAYEHFLAALTRLEQSDDIFGLNRARGNAAAVLIELGDLEAAGPLLRAAELEQVVLGDAAGLATTRHNAQVVRLRLSRGRR